MALRSRVAVVLLCVLAGCASNSWTPAPSANSPAPTTSVDAEAEIKAEVLRVYAEFMDARNASFADPTKPTDARLKTLTTPDQWESLNSTLAYLRANGLRVDGTPISNPEVPELSESEASLVDCLDSRGATTVDADTGKSVVAPGGLRKARVEVTLTPARNTWLVARWAPKRESPC